MFRSLYKVVPTKQEKAEKEKDQKLQWFAKE